MKVKLREDIVLKLKSWGHWASGRIGTEYPAVSVGMLPEPSSFHIPPLNEKEILQIEQIVLHLKQEDSALYDVIMLKYIYKLNANIICNKLDITPPTYFKRLATAEAGIAMILSFLKRQKRSNFI